MFGRDLIGLSCAVYVWSIQIWGDFTSRMKKNKNLAVFVPEQIPYNSSMKKIIKMTENCKSLRGIKLLREWVKKFVCANLCVQFCLAMSLTRLNILCTNCFFYWVKYVSLREYFSFTVFLWSDEIDPKSRF